MLLLLGNEDGAHETMLKTCKDVCPKKIHAVCFQRDGTRHVTLLKMKCTEAQAAQIKFTAPDGIALPASIGFDGFKRASSVLLNPDEKATDVLKIFQNVSNYVNPEGIGLKRSTWLHCSLYRVRSDATGYEAACKEIKTALKSTDLGAADGVQLVIKRVGSEYTHADGMRVLFP